MFIDIVNKSGNYIPTLGRTIEKILFRVSDVELGEYTIKTTFSPVDSFSTHYDTIPGDKTIRIKDNLSEAWTVVNGNKISITSIHVKYVDIEVSNIKLSDMIGMDAKRCYVKLKMENEVVEDQNKILISSPYYSISLTSSLSIEFDCTKLMNNQIRAAYINIDQYIEGSPTIKMQVSNTIVGVGNDQIPINYNWVDINNGDITIIPPIGSERVGKNTLRFKITITKSTNADIYRLYGILVDMVEDKLYKGAVL